MCKSLLTGAEYLSVEAKLLCSACGPTHYSDGTPSEYGKWHNHYPLQQFYFYYQLFYLHNLEIVFIIQFPNFIINYSETLEGPRSIKYTVMCPAGTASRAGMDFYTEKGIKTLRLQDYEANEWGQRDTWASAILMNLKEVNYQRGYLSNVTSWNLELEINGDKRTELYKCKVFISREYPSIHT